MRNTISKDRKGRVTFEAVTVINKYGLKWSRSRRSCMIYRNSVRTKLTVWWNQLFPTTVHCW